MKQWRKIFGGDTGAQFIATVGHGGGLGLAWHGSYYNGITIFLGPLVLDISPPLPKRMRDAINTPTSNG